MNYYPFHIGDFRGASMHLTNAEELAYRRALDWYYDTESPIPLDTQWVSRRLRVESADLETVLNDFFVCTDAGWTHARCDSEIATYQRQAEKNRANGAKGGRPKGSKEPKNNPAGFQSEAGGKPVESGTNPNQEPRTKNQKPNKEAAAQPFVLPDWIPADTWAAYCKVRTGKKAKNEPHALGLIVKDLEKFRAAGHDPVDCLNNSIKSGWAGVFEPKAKFADKNTLPPVSTVWHESAAGVIAKASELRLAPRDEVLETFPAFKARVLEAAGELVGA